MDGEVDLHEIYRVAARRLTAQIYGLTGDYAEAQDAVHEAFARALARPSLLRGVAAPEAWLRTVAMNVASEGERSIFGYTGSEPTSRPGKVKWTGKSLAVSRDGGRTWSVRKLPKDAVFRSVAVADGKRAYALYNTNSAWDMRLYRSDDGGQTWNDGHDVTLGRDAGGDEGLFGLADGSALLSLNSGMTRTTDGRKVMPRFAGLGPRAHVLAVPGGYVATGLRPEVVLWVSTDGGATWDKLPFASVG